MGNFSVLKLIVIQNLPHHQLRAHHESPPQGSGLGYGKKHPAPFILWYQYLNEIYLHRQICIQTNISSLLNKTSLTSIPFNFILHLKHTKERGKPPLTSSALGSGLFLSMPLLKSSASLISEQAKHFYLSSRQCMEIQHVISRPQNKRGDQTNTSGIL